MKNIIFLLFLLIISCKPNGFVREDGLEAFTVHELEAHLKTLASDEFMGRLPFSDGERKTY